MSNTLLIKVIIGVLTVAVILLWCLYYSAVHPKEEIIPKFQDLYSMDFDDKDVQYLLYVAHLRGGTVEEQANTIVVTLNRSVTLGYSIPDLVILEARKLGQPEYIPGWFVPSEKTSAAFDMVMTERFDDTEGSLYYMGREFS